MGAIEPVVHQVLDAAAGYAPVTDLIAVGDPDVRRVDGRWVMHVGAAFRGPDGCPAGVNIYTLTLPANAPLTSDDWSFVTNPGDPGQAQPLVELPGTGHFDEWLHTPCRVTGRVPGHDGDVERLYYTGTSGRDADPSTRDMAIGVLESVDGRWRRRDAPVVTGDPDRPCVLEPKAVFAEGMWRIWYQATHHEAGPGELPDCEIRYVESADGLTGWSAPRVVFGADDNWFDAAVAAPVGYHPVGYHPVGYHPAGYHPAGYHPAGYHPAGYHPAGYHMVTARAPNMFGPVPGLAPQGLWRLTASRPDGERDSWSGEPGLLLDADGGAAWYAGGTYGPCVVHEPGSGVLQVYFTGSAPPDPQPYVLSVGRIEVPLP